MADQFGPTNNSHWPTRVNWEAQIVDKSEVQRLWNNTLFGGINLTNAPRLTNQTLISSFTLLVSNRCTVAPDFYYTYLLAVGVIIESIKSKSNKLNFFLNKLN